ncbi:PKD-like domain-containing protein [Daejeonella sp. H1SJ63]|uniref:PKD-like domain-containing protein n=1 Tax=Daejeonella sp. H1SJ63 TaxID=3034145 RepID=UPI0023ED0E2D|nr:PKD-like domain-containing protein [Daejeonella sp. H1SJ63]
MKLIYRKLILFFFITALGYSKISAQCIPNSVKFIGGQPIYNTACGNNSYQAIKPDSAIPGNGQTYRWEVSFSGVPYSAIVNDSNSPITTSELSKNDITSFILNKNAFASGDYRIRRIVDDSSPVCTSTSEPVYLYYAQSQSSVSGGTISGTATYCSPASGTLMITGNTGPVLRWESAPAGTENWTVVKNINPGEYSNTLDYTNLTESRCYRALVDNICGGTAGVIDDLDKYSSTFCVTVNSSPIITSPANQILCLGSGLTMSVSVTSVLPVTYQWRKNGVNVSGQTSATLSIAAVAFTDAGSYDVIVSNACGSSTSTAATLTVNSMPVATVPANFTICAGANIAESSFSSTPSGATYTWTNSNTAIGLPASGSGNVPAFTAINTGTSNISATIIVTPYFNNCAGPTSSYTITVKPQPTVILPAGFTVCAGATVSSSSFSSSPAGATYTWTNSNTSIGLAASGTGNVPSFTAVNTTTSPVTATITVTPTINGCTGPPSTYTITINPLPVINSAVAVNETYCDASDGSISITASGAAPLEYSIDGGSTFIQNGGSFTGLAAGSYSVMVKNASGCVIAGPTLSISSPGAPPVPNINPFTNPVCEGSTMVLSIQNPNPLATYYWTGPLGFTATGTSISRPNVTPSMSGNYAVTAQIGSCVSDARIIELNVSQLPIATVPANMTYCTGATIPVGSFTSTPAGATYTWTNSNTAIGLAASGSGDMPTFTAVNTTSAPITATITITPKLNGCTGPTASYTITVNPLPVVSVPANQSFCVGTTIPASNFSSTPAGATYTWTNSNTAIGLTSSGSGNVPSFTAVNTGNTSISATITVIPTVNGCTGPSTTYTITVNPLPKVNVPADYSVCAGTLTTAKTFSSIPGGATYSWTNSNTAIGLAASGTGNLPAFTPVNNTTASISSIITVTPTLNGCVGPSSSFTITVNPQPAVILPNNFTVCAGETISPSNFSSSPAGATFTWVNSNTSIGLAASGAGNVPSFTALNNTASPQTATITVIPYLNGCAGPPSSYTITINPYPQLSSAVVVNETFCDASDGKITISATGAGPLEYSIDGGSTYLQNGGKFTGLMAGSYAVRVRNANGCILIGPTLSVSSPGAPPIPTITPFTSPVCEGSTLVLSIQNPNPLATYNWTGPLGFTATGTSISRPYANPSMSGDYAVTASIGSCVSGAKVISLIVSPLPVVTLPSNMLYCAGTTVPISSFASTPAGATYTWTNSNTAIGLAASGTGNVPSFTAANNSSAPVTATITVTPILNGCAGPASSYTITVNPQITVSVPASFAVCSGIMVGSPIFSSNQPGATFTWTNSNTAIGLAAAGSGNLPSFTAINSGTGSISATITVTPYFNGCTGPPTTYTITVNPLPRVNVPDNFTVCGGANVAASNFSSSSAGVTYTWTNSNTAIGLAASGTGNVPSFTAVNSGTNSISATIIVTPYLNGCAGLPSSYTITASPQPIVNLPSGFTVCAGATVSSSSFSSSPAGATYTWTNSNSTIGLAASGTGNVPSFTAVNTATSPVTTTITVTPSINGCTGPPSSYTITINPQPVINSAVAVNETVCDAADGSITIKASGAAPLEYSIDGGSTFIQNDGSFTRLAAGSYSVMVRNASGCVIAGPILSISSPGAPPMPALNPYTSSTCEGSTIVLSVQNPNPLATYTWTGPLGFTATGTSISRTNVAPSMSGNYAVTARIGSCVSAAKIIAIAVKPLPIATVPANMTYCAGATIPISSFTSTPAGATYTWTNSNTAIGLPASGSGDMPTFTAVNTTSATITATITITPVLNGCTGPAVSFTITVNPLPVISAIANQNVCSGATIPASNFISTPAGATYTWTNSNTAIGLASSGSGNVPSFTAINNGTASISSNITVTPYFNGCSGPSVTYTITVNPLPKVNVPIDYTLCAGTSVDITAFSSSSAGTTFTWTNSNTSIGLAASGSGNLPAFTAINYTSAPISTTITVTPTLNGCAGPSSSYTITINPLPEVIVPGSFIICAGATVSAQNFGSTPAGASFTWTNSNTSIGLPANGTGNVPSFTAVNNTSSPITATITVVPRLNGCAGPAKTYTITINPQPIISGISNSIVCAGEIIESSNFTSNIQGTTYRWTNSNTAIGLAASGTGNVPSFTALNSSVFAVSATITVTPVLNGCSGTPVKYTITINPLPVITSAVATAESQCDFKDGTIIISASGMQPLEYSIDGGSTFIRNNGNFTGLPAGSYSVMVRNAGGCIISGPTLSVSSPDAPPPPSVNTYANPVCEGTTLILSVKNPNPLAIYTWTGPLGFKAIGASITRPDSDPSMSGTYAVTATLNSCVSDSHSFDIVVSPLPTLTVPQNQTYCKGVPIPENILSSTPSGANFTWTNSRPEIGLAAGGSGNIPAFVATNNTNLPIIAIITITPTLNGCTGKTYTYTITVNPLPVIKVPASSVICADEIVPSSNFTSNISGTSYSWTNSNTAIGLAASGTGNVPSFKAANLTGSVITAVITVIPTVNGCKGEAISYSITVNPLPIISAAIATNETICNIKDGTITITASGTQPLEYSVDGGNTFVQNGGNFTGLEAGSYPVVVRNSNGCLAIGPILSISSPGAPPSPSVNTYSPICAGEPLVLSVLNPDPQITYKWVGPKGFTAIGPSVTRPNSDPSMSGNYAVTAMLNSCVSIARVFEVKINPAPALVVPESLTYCNGAAIPESYFYSTPPGATITWTNSRPEIGLPASGTGNVPSFNAINNTDLPITAVITVVPTLDGCQGPEHNFTITINPTPRVIVPADLILCAGTKSSVINFSSNTPGTTYTWTGSNLSIGLAASGSGEIPVFTAANKSTSIIQSIITVTPILNGCQGPSSSFTISVKPLPRLSNTSLSQSLCTGSNSKEVLLTSDIPGTSFTWTSDAPSGLEGYAIRGTNKIPVQTLINTKSVPDTITYTIIPTYDGCAGPASKYTIIIHPLPTATISGGKTACYGSTSTLNVKLTGLAPWTITYTDGKTPVTISRIGNSNFTFNVTSDSTRTYKILSVSDGLSCTNTGTGTATIVQPSAAIKATATSIDINCYGENTGAIQVGTVTGGFGTYEYSIDRGKTWQSNKKFSGLASGTYQVYVRDAQYPECITLIAPDILISQPESPISLKYILTDVSCYGDNTGSINTTPEGGTAPYTYRWSNGQITRDLKNLTAGTYTLTITDSKGCSYTESITIKQPAAPIKISYTKTDVSCFGGKDGSIDVKVTGGVLPYSFKWSNNQTSEDLQNLAPNISYALTVIDANGCSAIQIINIAEPEILKATLNVRNTICKSSVDGTITAEITGGTKPYNLIWKGIASKENTINNLKPGVYELLVTDAKGCTLSISGEVMAGNCPPVAVNDLFKTDEEIPVSGSVALNDYDREKEAISFTLISTAQNGTISFNSEGQFTYTPNVGFWGIETVTYRVCNTTGMCETAKLIIDVIPNTIVNLTPAQSSVSEGRKTAVTARLIRPFRSDVTIRIAYKGTATNNRDYALLDQYREIRIPKGKITTTQKITIAALTDDEKEGTENINISISSTSDPLVRIGTGAVVNILDIYPPVDTDPATLNNNLPANNDIRPDPLLSPNDDGIGNDFFKIDNIISFPDNEVLIFNRWGNQVFKINGYNESDRVFKGFANTGLLSNTNSPLVDGVYYYLITTKRTVNGQKITSMNKGYMILKR